MKRRARCLNTLNKIMSDGLFIFCDNCTKKEFAATTEIILKQFGSDPDHVQDIINKQFQEKNLPFVCECSRHTAGIVRVGL